MCKKESLFLSFDFYNLFPYFRFISSHPSTCFLLPIGLFLCNLQDLRHSFRHRETAIAIKQRKIHINQVKIFCVLQIPKRNQLFLASSPLFIHPSILSSVIVSWGFNFIGFLLQRLLLLLSWSFVPFLVLKKKKREKNSWISSRMWSGVSGLLSSVYPCL